MSLRAQQRLAVLIVLSAFGPYLVGSIRSEQIVIYGATALVVLAYLGRKVAPRPGMVLLIVLWATILAVSGISALAPPSVALNISPLAGIDALLAPLCLMLILTLWTSNGGGHREVLLTIQKATVVLLVLNTGLELAMTVNDALVPYLSSRWWSGAELSGDMRTIGEAAARNGRFGGVFNSPLAAGTAYSVGFIAAIHLYLSKAWTARLSLLAIAAVVVGGLLPQSKAFLLAGLPIGLLYLLVVGQRRRIANLYVFLGATAGVWWFLSSTQWWQEYGAPRFETLFSQSADPLYLYTAGRYVAGSNVGGIWDTVLDKAPIGGFGAGVNLGALDTSWTEMLARAGLIGFAAFVLWLFAVAVMWVRNRKIAPAAQWWATGAMLVVTVAAAAGGPSVTQNRAGTLLVMNLLALVAVRSGGLAGREVGVGEDRRVVGVRDSLRPLDPKISRR